MTATRSRPSRTQAERRANTQDVVLRATLRALVEDGYHALSVRELADRVGVSQGAIQHYYPTKAALVAAALGRLAQEIAEGALTDPPSGDSERARLEALIDGFWKIHNLPISSAVQEIVASSARDTAIAPLVAQASIEATELAVAVASQLAPELAQTPGFRNFILITLATMRGATLVNSVPGATAARIDWPATRASILRELDTLTAQPDPDR